MRDDSRLLFEPEKEENSEEDAAIWLITTSDMSMLLLACFVLLFAMSSPDSGRFADSAGSVRAALGTGEGKGGASLKLTQSEAGRLLDQVSLQRQIVEAQKKVFGDVQYFNTTKGLDGVIGATLENGTITLRAPGDVLFAPGQSDLTPKGREIVGTLKDFFIQHADQRVNIRGFTDGTPPRPGARYQDNWELSSLRAVTVLRYLIELGLEPNRLTATGLADLEPLFPNSSDANRSMNRRVEFVLEKKIGR